MFSFRSVAVFSFCLALVGFPLMQVNAAELKYDCSAGNGFNFDQAVQKPVGFVTEIKIDGKTLQPDLEIKIPEDPSQKRKVVGIIESINWKGGKSDPIQMSFFVSEANQGVLSPISSKIKDPTIGFSFTAIDFDQKAKKFFKAFHTDAKTFHGQLVKTGTGFEFKVEAEANKEVADPKNFKVSLGVVPTPIAQELHIGSDIEKKSVSPWSLK